MNPPKLCPACHAPIPQDAPGGLCPGCVLLGAMGGTEPLSGALADAPTTEELAAVFPDLEIAELIGHGGMGVIFKARQLRLDRIVALKILPPRLARQPGFTERFTREARALARLNHPNIVAVYDFGQRDQFCFLTMEYVNGVNLRQAMRAGVNPEQALGLVPRICEALQFAHDHGVLHRDIKPENILLDTAGVPKLADFGIAKLAEEKSAEGSLTMSGAALGTAAYMAPEQVEQPGTVDHRADIYSLGVVLYEMLTGELPLGRFAAPSAKAKVSAGVDEVVLRALEKQRERRQQSATEMKTQVEEADTRGGGIAGLRDDEWILRCPGCGHVRPCSEIVACSEGTTFGKKILAHCPACGFRGLTPMIQAGHTRGARFNVVPLVPERHGPALAIAGTLLNAIPIFLAWALAMGWFPGVPEGFAMFRDREETPGDYSPGLIISAAVTALTALVLTALALWGARYRARWFFRWLLAYGLITAPLGIGLVILGYCFLQRDQFAALADGEDPMDLSRLAGAANRGDARPRGMMAVFLGLTILAALFIPLAALNAQVRGYASPQALSSLVAIFGALFGFWPAIFSSRTSGAPISGRSPGGRWQIPLIFAAMSLPLALLVIALVLPIVHSHRGPAWVAVAVGLLVPVGVSVFAALIAGVCRAVVRAGAPKWAAACLTAFLILLVPIAFLAVSTFGLAAFARGVPPRPAAYESRPVVGAVTSDDTPSLARWDQASVELVAVTRHPSAMEAWWRMDGSRASEGPFINPANHVTPELGERAYEFYFHARNLPSGASQPVFLIQEMRSGSTGGVPSLVSAPEKPLGDYEVMAATLPAGLTSTNIKVGVAHESWHTLSSSHPGNSISPSLQHEGKRWEITHGPAFETKAGEVVTTFHHTRHPDWEFRVVAVDAAGNEIPTKRVNILNAQSEWHFPKLSLDSVKELRFQVRPIRWIEFRGVALRPAS